MQDACEQTCPIEKATFSDTANQWKIYDAYARYEQQNEAIDETRNVIKNNFMTDSNFNFKQLTSKTESKHQKALKGKIGASKWGKKLKPSSPSPIAENNVQNDELDELGLLTEEVIPKKVNFRRLLKEDNVETRNNADERLLKSAKVLERMVIQDENMEVAFGKC